MTVSGAIAIVLTALMGNIACLSSSWSGFEGVVALSELQRLFVEWPRRKSVPAMAIRRSTLCFPVTHAVKSVNVPILNHKTVLINGSGAPFADIITPSRLIRCKHHIAEGQALLDLRLEMAKMGVLKDDRYKDDAECYIQRFLTGQLDKQWDNFGDALRYDPGTDEAPETTAPPPQASHVRSFVPDAAKRSFYPMGQLGIVHSLNEVEFEKFDIVDEAFYHNQEEIGIRRDFRNAITIVFATNRDGFTLTNFLKMDTHIGRQHVSDAGHILKGDATDQNDTTEHIRTLLKDMVKPTVDVRFMFCSSGM